MSDINLNTEHNLTITSEGQLQEAAAAASNDNVGYPITEFCSVGCGEELNLTTTSEDQLQESAAAASSDSDGFPVTALCSIGCNH